MVTETALLEHLKEKYGELEKDFYFKTTQIAINMGASARAICHATLKLEKKGLIERSGFSSNRICWRTCFGKRTN